jgi:diguanylate cyclase (GGDEF)-like protein/PAS domain S-box-containing protein
MPESTNNRINHNFDFYENIIQSSDDAIISKSLDGIIESWNPGAETIFGYTAAEMIGQSMLILFPPERLEEENIIIEQIKQGVNVVHFETQRLRKDRNLIHVSVTISPIFNSTRQVIGASKIARDITERKKLESELQRQARVDYLTDVCNRRYFMELAEQEFRRTARYGNNLSLIMIDVDSFKQINDSYGHKAGDTVLKRLTEISLRILREVDTIGRIGGDEFTILLRETHQEGAKEVAERLRGDFAGEQITLEDQTSPIHFTVSMGLATLNMADKSIGSLLNRADKALYGAKRTGRNKVCIAPN